MAVEDRDREEPAGGYYWYHRSPERAWCLGDMLDSAKFKNYCMELAFRMYVEAMSPFCMENVLYVWNNTTEGSKLRRFCIDMLCRVAWVLEGSLNLDPDCHAEKELSRRPDFNAEFFEAVTESYKNKDWRDNPDGDWSVWQDYVGNYQEDEFEE
ncbi:hypothetical protein K402DRAFT_405031 [Aulographum hederae CBS 113979]|uniref:Uncharacterized protein n=1 Tax=Aulographum hederae CBS 113979 TaxID=1176131 RepID=A0A6G1GXQ2_9PEZI|nr:hypothetical protein K402DRAFT_405031 [Aulographum hederae CBS 113979]